MGSGPRGQEGMEQRPTIFESGEVKEKPRKFRSVWRDYFTSPFLLPSLLLLLSCRSILTDEVADDRSHMGRRNRGRSLKSDNT